MPTEHHTWLETIHTSSEPASLPTTVTYPCSPTPSAYRKLTIHPLIKGPEEDTGETRHIKPSCSDLNSQICDL
ncbi:hypothetical protein EG68_03034 [Paragonimus skrjabini miyazakii]|uniref:Uncharacterized protein n=1 Tax=Paragonimus skrjabini miyazakii TaxID=59628 RepID=A0A8S9Z1V4_9TREM|nr:hypothetical protein EG68_03034 [Paragonimus skrjabini miyazakii]